MLPHESFHHTKVAYPLTPVDLYAGSLYCRSLLHVGCRIQDFWQPRLMESVLEERKQIQLWRKWERGEMEEEGWLLDQRG